MSCPGSVQIRLCSASKPTIRDRVPYDITSQPFGGNRTNPTNHQAISEGAKTNKQLGYGYEFPCTFRCLHSPRNVRFTLTQECTTYTHPGMYYLQSPRNVRFTLAQECAIYTHPGMYYLHSPRNVQFTLTKECTIRSSSLPSNASPGERMSHPLTEGPTTVWRRPRVCNDFLSHSRTISLIP